MFAKTVVFVGLCGAYAVGTALFLDSTLETRTAEDVRVLSDNPVVAAETRVAHRLRNESYAVGAALLTVLGLALYWPDMKRLWEKVRHHPQVRWVPFLLLVFALPGCIRPFEPIKLETINTNEEAFLIPLVGDGKTQTSTQTEEYLTQNLVYSKQVKMPQQWVQKGYEWLGVPNGNWRDAAILVKVDKSPVTREWTADPNSGTSNRNEAIWVMTSDQVEFSTGWTCTARIASREDAVRFLHNYPNGTLTKVMDQEVRARIQTAFGLEVTDQPMQKLRLEATPHLTKVVDDVTSFFHDRGVTITNLGISGGFIYKDVKVSDKLVELFNAEQDRAVAEAKAAALLTQKKAEAEGIKQVADAKAYEIEKAHENMEMYVALKRLELEKEKVLRWNGSFPTYFMGQNGLDMLLTVPQPVTAK
jgi:hypothetical protein